VITEGSLHLKGWGLTWGGIVLGKGVGGGGGWGGFDRFFLICTRKNWK